MRWGYSNLSLIMWMALAFYVLIMSVFFRLIALGKNKKKAFNLVAIALVAVHSILLMSLGLNDSEASLKRVGFEAWVCGRPVQLVDTTPAGRIFKEGGYFSKKMLNVNSDSGTLRVGAQLKGAGLTYSDKSVAIPVSNEFELKVAGDNTLNWLAGTLKYPAGTNQPTLQIENGKLTCPTGDLGTWNVFIAKVDNIKKTYSWQKVALQDLDTVLIRASDGDDLPDCLVIDYDIAKMSSEYRCADILKNDASRCPETDKSKCMYKELRV